MIQMLPEVKEYEEKAGYSKLFSAFEILNHNVDIGDVEELARYKFWNIHLPKGRSGSIRVIIDALRDRAFRLKHLQGYTLLVCEDEIRIGCDTNEGLSYALSTLKQLMEDTDEGFRCKRCNITDWPIIEYRSISTTFSWYAGYGRYGFDMQLWNEDQWKQFLNVCSDYKINQMNLCIYGYWPFDMPEYPEAMYKGVRMKLWNPESENWIEVEFMHPNVAQHFLPGLIEYGHKLGIKFFAYIGLNSYSGGYANAHKDKRMKMPPGSKFINDFDSLCLSDPTTIAYLKSSMKYIVGERFDGVIFEESEEAFWYCECDRCRATFWKGAATPEETLHAANTMLLKVLYDELKFLKPDIVIGIRAWRQPPLVRSDELIRSMVDSIPEDVKLFWAPGQYVEDSEFDKWIAAFGKERIRARDTEAIGFASGLGRLIRPFKFNGLRCGEEAITQYVEEDIRQHIGSAKRQVAGINGYQFEWYGFFMALFAHSYDSWGGELQPEAFYQHVLYAVFKDLADDILFVVKNMLMIHESQLNIFELEFPFAKNKVEERDIPRIRKAIDDYPVLIQKLDTIMEKLEKDPQRKHFRLHFKKWKVSLQRNRVICDMGLESLQYAKATTEEEKRAHLMKIYDLNEKEFGIIKANYFDVNPMRETGIKSCMIPYHELKRILTNKLYPEKADDEYIYLGVESLGWMWCKQREHAGYAEKAVWRNTQLFRGDIAYLA